MIKRAKNWTNQWRCRLEANFELRTRFKSDSEEALWARPMWHNGWGRKNTRSERWSSDSQSSCGERQDHQSVEQWCAGRIKAGNIEPAKGFRNADSKAVSQKL